ncbi:hypothetical protein NQZ68_027596 [Dissostichus eleginoides]|nr:hypothetical protein NQZ68_027596 [Dissostichus eleginoides]
MNLNNNNSAVQRLAEVNLLEYKSSVPLSSLTLIAEPRAAAHEKNANCSPMSVQYQEEEQHALERTGLHM